MDKIRGRFGNSVNGANARKMDRREEASSEFEFTSIDEVISVVENVPINILVADLDLNIKFVNRKSTETLQKLQHLLPIPAERLKGASIDIFHKNPSHQRKILSSDKNLPHRAVINLGPERLDLLVNAIYSKSGEWIGSVLTWDVVTEKLKTQSDAARLQSMVENAPINILMADRDFKVVFMNPKSYQTLKTLEKYLPISTDKIIGQSIDIFHKNPGHQRRILDNDRNLPHFAKIKLGPETLSLLVTAVYDQDKKYIGAMVTWDVISDRVTLVNTLEETSNNLSAAAAELTATATQMSGNSSKTSSEATSAAAAAEEVSKGVQNVATNTEEMSAAIKEIARSSAQAAEMTKESLSQAQGANTTINQLGISSQEIGNVIKVISSIAQQTNLLALNATIEAARAGEAGKGFAVVANEVKELAKQTAKATEEITTKIGTIQGDSKQAVSSIIGISQAVEKLNGIATSIAASVEEQTATTNEVSRIVQESNKAVDGIAQTIKAVSGAAEESSAGANATLKAAEGLTQLAEKLKALVTKVQI